MLCIFPATKTHEAPNPVNNRNETRATLQKLRRAKGNKGRIASFLTRTREGSVLVYRCPETGSSAIPLVREPARTRRKKEEYWGNSYTLQPYPLERILKASDAPKLQIECQCPNVRTCENKIKQRNGGLNPYVSYMFFWGVLGGTECCAFISGD